MPDQDEPDTVVVLRDDGDTTVERKGRITDWRGQELVLETATGSRRIPGDSVVAVRTAWPEPVREAREAMAQSRWDEAAIHFSNAIGQETRPWAQAELRAELVRLLDLDGQVVMAGREFLRIIADDPSSRHFPAIPLAWDSTLIGPDLERFAGECLDSRIPAARLFGASWLLGSSRREEALRALQELGRDIEPRIAHLASAQLWRAAVVVASPEEVQRWREQTARMAPPLRPGPLLVLAAADARLGRTDDALLSLLAIPILHAEHLSARRLALRRAHRILRDAEREEEAERIEQELRASFPGEVPPAGGQPPPVPRGS